MSSPITQINMIEGFKMYHPSWGEKRGTSENFQPQASSFTTAWRTVDHRTGRGLWAMARIRGLFPAAGQFPHRGLAHPDEASINLRNASIGLWIGSAPPDPRSSVPANGWFRLPN